jgi:hypothetical protein
MTTDLFGTGSTASSAAAISNNLRKQARNDCEKYGVKRAFTTIGRNQILLPGREGQVSQH